MLFQHLNSTVLFSFVVCSESEIMRPCLANPSPGATVPPLMEPPRDYICVTDEVTCDGMSHCLDGYDESYDVCFNQDCPPHFFHCGSEFDPSQLCAPIYPYAPFSLFSPLCDGTWDCVGGSDEDFCDESCGPDEFK